MSRPRVLVLLAAYQGAPWIVEQIDSILGQQGVDVCIDIADDRSSDGTLDLVAARYPGDARIRRTSWQTASGSAGENFRRLIRAAEVDGFECVAFADQDDLWHPDKLACALERLEASGALGYSSAVEAFWPDGRRGLLGQCRRPRAADFLFEGAGQGCTFVLTRTFFVRLRALVSDHADVAAGMYYHDWQVYVAARAQGRDRPWHFDERPSMAYRQHQSNDLGARKGTSGFMLRLKRIQAGWYRAQVQAALRFYRAADGRDPIVDRFGRLFDARASLRRRLSMAVFVLRHGRRRWSDRLVLGFSSLAGWL